MFDYQPLDMSHVPALNRVERYGMRFYRNDATGDEYPSITTVLSIHEKPALVAWRESMGAERAEAETFRCSERGTALHLMCERWLSNIPNPTEGIAPEPIKLFNKMKTMKRRFGKVLALEVYLYSTKWKIAGTADCVAYFDGLLSVIDFKSATGLKNENMIEDYFIQESFYAEAWEERTGMKIEQIVTLMASERGLVPLVWKKIPTNYLDKLADKRRQFDEHLALLKQGE